MVEMCDKINKKLESQNISYAEFQGKTKKKKWKNKKKQTKLVDDDFWNEERGKPMSKAAMFEAICEEINQEEERLPMWILMTKEEKLDMLAHQVIEQETQIMAFFIEYQYGIEKNFN